MRIILDEAQIADIDMLTPKQRAILATHGPMYTIECLSGMKNIIFDGLGPNYEAVHLAALNMKEFFEDCTNAQVEFTDLVKEKHPEG